MDFEYLCDQCSGVQSAHERASERAEYGVNFFEFIYTTDIDLRKMIEKWWYNDLTLQRRTEIIEARYKELKDKFEGLQEAMRTEQI